MGDIKSKQDVELLINNFYSKVRKDDILAPHFKDIDWDHHTPVIVDFWCMALLGDTTYKGNPFSKHIKLKLTHHDFTQWLHLFHETVNELFEGQVAEEAKNRSSNIAALFQYRLGISPTL